MINVRGNIECEDEIPFKLVIYLQSNYMCEYLANFENLFYSCDKVAEVGRSITVAVVEVDIASPRVAFGSQVSFC